MLAKPRQLVMVRDFQVGRSEMLRWVFTGLFIAICTLSLPGRALADDLIDAIQAAIETHPRLMVERANLRAAREALPLALAPYRPQMSLQASTARSERSATLSDGSVIDDETSPTTYTLQASQTLWAGGRRELAHRRGVLEVRLAEARHASAERAIILDIATAYLDLIYSEEALAIELQAFADLQHQQEAVQTRLSRGVATRTDLAQVDARLAEAQARLAAVRTNQILARARFERETGFPPEDLSWTAIELPTTDLDDLKFLARDFSHDLAGARIEAELARLNLMEAQRSSSPVVSLGVQHSQSDNASPALLSDDDTRVSLNLRMPLLSGGENRARRRQAVANRSAARFALRDAEAEVDLFTTEDWARERMAVAALSAETERLRSAELALEGVERGLNAGLWTIVDVLDASDQVLRARLSLAEATRELRLARVRLALSSGAFVY